jgi:hypothetical protein
MPRLGGSAPTRQLDGFSLNLYRFSSGFAISCGIKQISQVKDWPALVRVELAGGISRASGKRVEPGKILSHNLFLLAGFH